MASLNILIYVLLEYFILCFLIKGDFFPSNKLILPTSATTKVQNTNFQFLNDQIRYGVDVFQIKRDH